MTTSWEKIENFGVKLHNNEKIFPILMTTIVFCALVNVDPRP